MEGYILQWTDKALVKGVKPKDHWRAVKQGASAAKLPQMCATTDTLLLAVQQLHMLIPLSTYRHACVIILLYAR